MGALCCNSPILHTGDQDIQFKIVLVGEAYVGKTSVFNRYTKEEFHKNYDHSTTLGIGKVCHTSQQDTKYSQVKVVIWDPPLLDSFDERILFYRDIDAAIVVVDLTNEDSISFAGAWKQDVIENATQARIPCKRVTDNYNNTHTDCVPIPKDTTPIFLLGTKYDLVAEYTEQNPDKIMTDFNKCAEQFGFTGSAIVSSKDNDKSIHNTVQQIVEQLTETKAREERKKISYLISGRGPVDPQHQTDEQRLQISLERTGIEELDELFTSCNPYISNAVRTSTTLSVARRSFTKACYRAMLTGYPDDSIIECVMYLKNELGTVDNQDPIEVIEDGGFLQLVVTNMISRDVNEEIKSVLKLFYDEVVCASKEILSVCPGVETFLMDLDGRVVARGRDIWQLAVLHSKKTEDVKAAQDTIERNRRQIARAQGLARVSLRLVDRTYQEVKEGLSLPWESHDRNRWLKNTGVI